MTVINTSYTSLEDAWGSNFDVEQKKPKKKSKSSKSSDPLCELYGKRYKKARKPYTATKERSRYTAYRGGVDTTNYHGFRDDPTQLAEFENDMDQVRFETGTCVDTSSPPNAHDDEDDEYLHNAIIDEESTENRDFKKIFSNVYDESEDEITSEEMPENTNAADSISCSKLSKSITQMVEDEIKHNKALHQLEMEKCFVDERQYLDIIMYTLSGVIVIFMMEQFIQIGMRLKST